MLPKNQGEEKAVRRIKEEIYSREIEKYHEKYHGGSFQQFRSLPREKQKSTQSLNDNNYNNLYNVTCNYSFHGC